MYIGYNCPVCVGTFQKADPRNVDVFINKTGLPGKYQVKSIAEEKLYETGVVFEHRYI